MGTSLLSLSLSLSNLFFRTDTCKGNRVGQLEVVFSLDPLFMDHRKLSDTFRVDPRNQTNYQLTITLVKLTKRHQKPTNSPVTLDLLRNLHN